MANLVMLYEEKMSKVAVIVETREHKAMPFVLNNVMSVLPDDWDLQIFHGSNNLNYITDVIQNDELLKNKNIYFNDLNTNELNHGNYVKLFTSLEFWNSCEGEIILIFQTDSMLCPNSKYKIEDFEHFNYIGGYWGNVLNPLDFDYNRVMNGGLSLRKKSFMLDIIKNKLQIYLDNGGNPCEDYFVSACLKETPTVKEVLSFCIDNGYMYPLENKAPFALHNPWGTNLSKGHGKYYDEIKKVCEGVEELERLNGL